MSQVEQIGGAETRQDDTAEDARQRSLAKVWLARIKEEEKAHNDYRQRARQVQEVYNDDLSKTDNLYVPLLWSVVQVQHSGVYSSQPVPDCRPRNDEKNPVFRQASDVLERSLAYCVDDQSFDDNFHRAVDDYLAMGLGVCRVKLDSEIMDAPPDPFAQQQAGMGMEPEPQQTIGDQSLRWEYVPWARFGWEPGNNWFHCDWIYFRHRMTNLQIKDRFGRAIKASKDDQDKTSTNSWMRKTFDIYEVWDKKARKVLFIAKGEMAPVEVSDDPLQLANFYPIPIPMMTNVPSEELIPQPDYNFIEQYDIEINRLQMRRMALLEQLKASGVYDKGLAELGEILEQDDGQMKPVQNLLARMQGQGFDNAMYFLPLEEKAIVIAQLTEQIQFVKAQVEEILGIADIVRGVSNANEGVGTQQLKSMWVGVRLTRKREMVQYTVREMMRIMAQLLTTHFTDENLMRLTQLEIAPETLDLLRDDLMMDFSIDIETESTVAKDEFRERETRQEMLTGVGAFAQSVLPMVQQGFMPADVSSAILRAALQPYTKYSRALDESLAGLQDTQQQLGQMQQQIQQGQMENQQLTQQLQQWQAIANQLQMRSTQAASEQKEADAFKKRAETAEIIQGLDEGKVPAEVDLLEAQAGKADREPRAPSNGAGS